jgi:uncharacterized protein YyaL (SSP411 family)
MLSASPRPATGVLREMTAESGGFAASYDADSEGVEGKFYVWDAAEIDAVLGREDGAFFRKAYDVTLDGNWEHHNILHRNHAPTLLSSAGEQRLAGLRAKLKAVRDKRVWPGWDDKVLADWNGLMIAASPTLGRSSSATTGWPPRCAPGASSWTDARRDGRLFHSHASASGCIAARSTTTPTWRAPASRCSRRPARRLLDEARALIAVLDRHFADARPAAISSPPTTRPT